MIQIDIDIRSKVYPKAGISEAQCVIENFRLSLKQNQFVCLVGPSGCGKTTLLNIVGGLDTDYEGKINAKRESNPTIGTVFQNPRLLPWRTARENIELVLRPDQNNELVDVLFESMGLSKVSQVFPERLSLGMSRRVALARAFAVEPDLLIMDEPFVSLDPPTARRIRQRLLKVWEQRPHTVLFVTHNLREAISLADRLIFLSHSPMQLLHDVFVDVPRAHRNNEEALEAFCKRLKKEYKDLDSLL